MPVKSPISFATAALAFLLATGVAVQARAQDRAAVEKGLEQAYEKKIVTLRGFYGGPRLVYGPDGGLIRGGDPGPWTVDGEVQITQIRLRRDRIDLTGDRIFLVYNREQKSFQNLRGGAVKITLNLPAVPVTSNSVAQALHKAFLGTDDRLEDAVPAYWKPFLKGESEVLARGVRRSTDNPGKNQEQTSPPVPVSDPNPPYTPEARRAKYSGDVSLVVTVDALGKVTSVVIATPAGLGLDDQAVQTVQTWQFRPALRNGEPVRVRASVEVRFRLSGGPAP